MKYDLENRADGWWVVGFPCGDMGPYRTKQDAQDDAQGVKKFYTRDFPEWRQCYGNQPTTDGGRNLF